MLNCFNWMSSIGAINKLFMLRRVIFCQLLVNCINVLYLVSICNCLKPYALLIHWFGSTAKKEQLSLLFLPTSCLHYSFICNLLFLFPICSKFSLTLLFYCYWIFGAADSDHERAMPVHLGLFLDIRPFFISLIS